jgi:hypothetical protein
MEEKRVVVVQCVVELSYRYLNVFGGGGGAVTSCEVFGEHRVTAVETVDPRGVLSVIMPQYSLEQVVRELHASFCWLLLSVTVCLQLPSHPLSIRAFPLLHLLLYLLRPPLFSTALRSLLAVQLQSIAITSPCQPEAHP